MSKCKNCDKWKQKYKELEHRLDIIIKQKSHAEDTVDALKEVLYLLGVARKEDL